MRPLLVVPFALMAMPQLAGAQSLPAPSTWMDDKGSVLTISQLDGTTGEFTGNFINNAPDTACKGAPGYDISGTEKGDETSFFVTFKNQTDDCHTITLWSGKVAGDTLSTTWELIYVFDSDGDEMADGFA